MAKAGTIAIGAVVIVIIVVAAALFASGVISFQSPSSNSVGASNVVGESAVNSALGGNWGQGGGSTGTVSNSAGLDALFGAHSGSLPTTLAGPAMAAQTSVNNPVLKQVQTSGYQLSLAGPPSSPFYGLISFEFSIFGQNTSGPQFLTVGYLQYNVSASPLFNDIWVNATNTSFSNSSMSAFMYKGTTQGYEFVMVSAHTFTSKFNISLLVGYTGDFFIFMAYAGYANQTLAHFESLYANEAKLVASISQSFRSTFVSASNLTTDTGITWTQDITTGIGIHNAKELIYSAAYVMNMTIPNKYKADINNTIGSITEIGIGVYTNGSMSNPSNAAILGYVTFSSSSSANSSYTVLTLALSGSPIVGGGTFASGPMSGDEYTNITLPPSMTGGSIYDTIMIVDAGTHLVYLEFGTTSALSFSDLTASAAAEVAVA